MRPKSVQTCFSCNVINNKVKVYKSKLHFIESLSINPRLNSVLFYGNFG